MAMVLETAMAHANFRSKGSFYGEAVLSLFVLTGLALPFIPLPGDHLTRIAVEFRTPTMSESARFSARTKRSICLALEATMSFGDPRQGEFTRIDCGSARAPAPIPAARAS
jgi:hypothetical protein